MNIIITGGAGFIGQSLCKKLLEDPSNRLLCIDNFSTGDSKAIDVLANESGGRLMVTGLDVAEELHPAGEGRTYTQFLEEKITKVFNGSLHQIYHLACPASPSRYQLDPIKTLMTSVIGTRNMLNVANTFEATILFTSTSEIYGDPEVSVQHESYKGSVNCTGPRACYDEGKRAGETLCFDYHRKYHTNIKVVRIFNTYGPGMQPDDGRVVSNFIVQALSGNDLTVYGDGAQTRSFCFVDDMVEGLMLMMNSSNDIVGPINLGNPVEITVGELALRVLDQIQSGGELVLRDLPIDDPRKRKPDISKANKLLGWHPRYDLAHGLSKTIQYFSSKIGINA